MQGHSNGVYPLIFLPGGLEPDSEDEDEDTNDLELSHSRRPKPVHVPINTDENLLIAQADAVVTASADATAKVWSLYSGECLHVGYAIGEVDIVEAKFLCRL